MIRPARRKALTDMFVKTVKPEVKPFPVYDTKQPNLVLFIYPSGNRAWKVRYSKAGRARWYSIGSPPGVGLADARKMAGEVMVEVAGGGDPHGDRLAKKNAGTFAELVAAYVERRGSKSMRQYQAQFDRWALPAFGSMPAGEVTRAHVKKLFNERKKASPSAAKMLLAAISGCYAWALFEDWEGVTINPGHNVASVKLDPMLQAKSRERVLSDDEIVRFWHHWEEYGLLRSTALKLILLTGARPGEVSNMRLQDIDGHWWTQPGEPNGRWPGTKNGRSHRVYLTDDTLALIHRLTGSRTTGLALKTPRDNAIGHLHTAMAISCKALGIADRARPHDLRRTFGTLVTQCGFTRDAMDRVLNHHKPGVGGVYDRNTYAPEAQAIQETVGRHVAGLVDGGGSTVIELKPRSARR